MALIRVGQQQKEKTGRPLMAAIPGGKPNAHHSQLD